MAKEKSNLVIVESPAKAKTIGKYLGPGYTVTASMGHLRDLPKSKLGVDIENGFIPDYQPVKAREDTIKALKSAAKKSENIYLATDPDREGEAISWHLKELLELPDDKTFRVTFNEITQNVVSNSIENPRSIDMDLVNAQQARRILDRIVGYQLSPLLWKKIKRGLSAGRVQSVASRMVVDRENEIRNFIPKEYWILSVDLDLSPKPGAFTALFHGNEKKKMELRSEEEVRTVVDAVKQAPFTVRSVKRTDRKRSPSPPFITSSLQQEASRRMNMTPQRTMAIAQQLYEGTEIPGEGTIGLITYMRTDSLRISDDAMGEARNFISSTYGDNFIPDSPNRFRSRANAQDAHEAIRPTNVFITPDRIKGSVTNDQLRVYRLIWSRYVASQMAPAILDSVTVDVLSAGYVFRANHTAVKFQGFMAVYEESSDEEAPVAQSPLPEIEQGDPLTLKDVKEEQKFTQPPGRYTEATLIRAMEETGVGRPSTYAPTISTILNRDYVVKEGKNLRPTPLGEVVTELMISRFSDIVDLKFTARMEETLDGVEKGNDDWKDVLDGFYSGFKGSLDSAESALEGERIKVPDEVSDEICDECGKQMVVKSGRFGRFLGCPGFPDCTFTKPLVIEMPGKCPNCGLRILKRTSRNGYTYYACEKLKECGFLTWDVPVADNCPKCEMTMFKLSGRGARKPFCINEKCEDFLPEDARGYRKKPEEVAQETQEVVQETANKANDNATAAIDVIDAKAKTSQKAAAATQKSAKASNSTAKTTKTATKKATSSTRKTTAKK
ncbi:MAG: type I DNA topoisomerase [Oscillospiraceae bacterium]|nr:type I DNA topoisomerase [Oscillospiraceae bacterium]